MQSNKDDEFALQIISTDNGAYSKEKQFPSPTQDPGKPIDADETTGKNEEDEMELLSATLPSLTTDWTVGFRGACLTLIVFLIDSVLLMFFMNFVHTRMPRDVPPLPDLGHDWIPELKPENLGDYSMKSLIVMMVVAMILNRNRWPILIRFFQALGNLYLLRMVSILVTSLPPTTNHCRTDFPKLPNIYWNTFVGLISFGGGNIHCGDLMFSGHTCTTTNVWMVFMLHYKKNNLLRFVATILLLLTCYFIVATRSHYTADIWIAFWLTVLVHYNSPSYFPFAKRHIVRSLKKWF